MVDLTPYTQRAVTQSLGGRSVARAPGRVSISVDPAGEALAGIGEAIESVSNTIQAYDKKRKDSRLDVLLATAQTELDGIRTIDIPTKLRDGSLKSDEMESFYSNKQKEHYERYSTAVRNEKLDMNAFSNRYKILSSMGEYNMKKDVLAKVTEELDLNVLTSIEGYIDKANEMPYTDAGEELYELQIAKINETIDNNTGTVFKTAKGAVAAKSRYLKKVETTRLNGMISKDPNLAAERLKAGAFETLTGSERDIAVKTANNAVEAKKDKAYTRTIRAQRAADRRERDNEDAAKQGLLTLLIEDPNNSDAHIKYMTEMRSFLDEDFSLAMMKASTAKKVKRADDIAKSNYQTRIAGHTGDVEALNAIETQILEDVANPNSDLDAGSAGPLLSMLYQAKKDDLAKTVEYRTNYKIMDDLLQYRSQFSPPTYKDERRIADARQMYWDLTHGKIEGADDVTPREAADYVMHEFIKRDTRARARLLEEKLGMPPKSSQNIEIMSRVMKRIMKIEKADPLEYNRQIVMFEELNALVKYWLLPHAERSKGLPDKPMNYRELKALMNK